jgi:hypothetical protein
VPHLMSTVRFPVHGKMMAPDLVVNREYVASSVFVTSAYKFFSEDVAGGFPRFSSIAHSSKNDNTTDTTTTTTEKGTDPHRTKPQNVMCYPGDLNQISSVALFVDPANFQSDFKVHCPAAVHKVNNVLLALSGYSRLDKGDEVKVATKLGAQKGGGTVVSEERAATVALDGVDNASKGGAPLMWSFAHLRDIVRHRDYFELELAAAKLQFTGMTPQENKV